MDDVGEVKVVVVEPEADKVEVEVMVGVKVGERWALLSMAMEDYHHHHRPLHPTIAHHRRAKHLVLMVHLALATC